MMEDVRRTVKRAEELYSEAKTRTEQLKNMLETSPGDYEVRLLLQKNEDLLTELQDSIEKGLFLLSFYPDKG